MSFQGVVPRVVCYLLLVNETCILYPATCISITEKYKRLLQRPFTFHAFHPKAVNESCKGQVF